MGLDIGVIRIVDGRWDRTTPHYRWVGRLVGERAFARAEFPHDYRDGQAPDEYPEWRPSDFDVARRWVSESSEIPDGNKAAFRDLLAALEADPHLWVYVSV